MEYVTKSQHELPLVDGIILQGPVSDREGLKPLMEKDGRSFQESLAHATRMLEEGHDQDYMPKSLLPVGYDSPITAYRWHSLISVWYVLLLLHRACALPRSTEANHGSGDAKW